MTGRPHFLSLQLACFSFPNLLFQILLIFSSSPPFSFFGECHAKKQLKALVAAAACVVTKRDVDFSSSSPTFFLLPLLLKRRIQA
jgi:hypothetical protein